jgi:dolichol-phosphate mannosyltransferase
MDIKENLSRIIKYGLVAVLGIFVNYFFLFLFYDVIGVYYLVAAGIAVEISILSNFIFNDLWTFKDRMAGKKRMSKFFRFNLLCLGGLVINLSILALLKEKLGLNIYFAELFGILGGFSWNFVFSNYWVWKSKLSGN